jgi:ribosomal protein L7Ae-like RNA K-turn-binding protein
MSEEVVAQTEQIVEEVKPLDRIGAIQIVLSIATHHGGVLKGVAEVLKSLEAGKAKVVFLADDCDNEQYKETVRTLAEQTGVPVVDIPTWIELKDFCKLGMNSATIIKVAEEKGKEAKIKPRCSVAAIVDFGEDSEARQFLEKELSA